MSTPVRINSPAGINSDTQRLLALHAPMTGGSLTTLYSGEHKQPMSDTYLDETSNNSLHRELKRSRTKLTVVGPPVAVAKMDSHGLPVEPRFVHGSIKMLKV
jgi:hypothetical protein